MGEYKQYKEYLMDHYLKAESSWALLSPQSNYPGKLTKLELNLVNIYFT